MVKLSRIVKRSLVKSDAESTKVDSDPVTNVESFASKGKTQPTIDFSDLDNLNHEIVSMRNSSVSEGIKCKKAKVKVIKKNAPISKPGTNKWDYSTINSKIKQKLRAKLLGKDDISPKPTGVGIPTFSAEKKEVTGPDKGIDIKVKKTVDKTLSRGKRKRELRKESWRRKHTFEAEAKKIIESYQREDKYGKALGSFVDMQSQLDLVNESIGSAKRNDSSKDRGAKRTRNTWQRDRKLLAIATTNV